MSTAISTSSGSVAMAKLTNQLLATANTGFSLAGRWLAKANIKAMATAMDIS
jgi:hypothetical protein